MSVEQRFFNLIDEQLTHSQASAKRKINEQGFGGDVSLSPTFRLSYSVLKRETGRQRMKDAFYQMVVRELERRGLIVRGYDNYMVITKPYVDHCREFESLTRLIESNILQINAMA